MAERGRPTKLDPERRKQLCGLVSVGFSRWHAARHLGVGRTTLFRAAKQDPEFEEQLRNAELHQELKPIKRIADHPSWRAMAWLLERQKPELYVRRAPDTVTLGDLYGLFNALMRLLLNGVAEADREKVSANFEELFQELGNKKRSSPRVRRALKKLGLDQPAGAHEIPKTPVEPAPESEIPASSAENAEQPANPPEFRND